MHLVYLISLVKRMHQNVGENTFKMQVEHTGAGIWSAVPVIMGQSNWESFACIDVPARFFCGVWFFREYRIWFETIVPCGAERADAWSVSASVFGRGPILLCSPSPLGRWLSWGEWCRGAWLGTWCLGLLLGVCKVRSNGSEGSVLLRPLSGAGGGWRVQGCGSRE